jgi:hypothetical protein
MGERSPPEVVAGETPAPSRVPLLVLALALALLVALAVVPKPALDGESGQALLLARSLASDGDRVWQVEDRARVEGLVARGEVAEGVVAHPDDYGEPLEGPIVYGLFLAPWAAIAGARGALLAQGVLLAVAALFAASTLRARAGLASAWLPGLLLFASAGAAYALRLWPETMLASLLMIAFALVRGAEPISTSAFVPGEPLPDLFPEEPAPGRGPGPLRWAVVGAVVGAVASAAPWTLPLLWPAAVAAPPATRRRATVLLVGAALLTLGVLAVAGAATAGGTPTVGALVRGLGWEMPPLPQPRVLMWDVAYALAGRHLGGLFYFAPLLVLAGLAGPSRERRALPIAVLLSLLLLLLLRPFDLAGGALALGLRPLLPLGAALCLAATRPAGRVVAIVTCLWSAVWLWPLWIAPRHPFGEAPERIRIAAPYLAPWAPLETTQPSLAFGTRVRFPKGSMTVLGADALSGGTVASVPTDSWLEVLAGVSNGAPGFWVEGGEQVGTELPVRGGEVSDTIFRPDGGVSFFVKPKSSVATHPMPGSARPWTFYHVSVRFPGPAGRRFTVRLRPG